MNKYKVCVYAICKNESKFIKRWYNSMKEADYIVVLDTGSTDNSVEILKKLKVICDVKEYNNFRFDIARNDSLKLIPDDTDICVCTDLDEVFEKGWRKKLENAWKEDTTRARYNYNWNFDKDMKPATSFYINKIHKKGLYEWIYPVHEVLKFIGECEQKEIVIDDITVNHYADNTKSRSNYLNLLELSVKEYPFDDRNMHYLGREYMFHEMYNESIDTLIKHLNMKSATWKDERCASMRFIARCYIKLNRYEEAKMWYQKAIVEAPYLREPYVESAILDYQLKDYKSSFNKLNEALKIVSKNKSYINESFCWDETIYDLLSVDAFFLEDYEEAYKNSVKANEMNPLNERLQNNLKIIEKLKK